MKGPERTPAFCGSLDIPSGSANNQAKPEHVSDSGDPPAVAESAVRDHLMRFLTANPPDDWGEKGVDILELTDMILKEDEVLKGFVETNLELYEQVKQEYPDQNIDEWWWKGAWWWPWR